MAKKYARINWQNSPNTATPINATNLNKMDKGIDDLDDAIEGKFDKSNIIRTATVNDPDKVPSSEVTHDLQNQIEVLDGGLANIGNNSASVVMSAIFGGATYSTSVSLPRASNHAITLTTVALTGVRYLDPSEYAGKFTMVKYANAFRINTIDEALKTLLENQMLDIEYTVS